MRFDPAALLVFVAFCVLLMLALSTGSAAFRVAEAVVTMIIVLGVGGLMKRTTLRWR